jgi:predicted nuclease with RNAse H fold
MSIVCGIHVMPVVDAIASPRRSCVVGVDATGRVDEVALVDTDDAIIDAIPSDARVVALDAPVSVTNATGRRPVESILSWLDVAAFPNSTDRLAKVYGGTRGVVLAARLDARPMRVIETLPDLVLREIDWERAHAPDAPPMELSEYRAAWLGVRAPRYRPKGTGRATPSGRSSATALLARVLDLNGWVPAAAPDDWHAIGDAAVLDAMACAYTAWRLAVSPETCLVLPDPDGPFVAPADANLRLRAALHIHRA